jgi:hypothetical protein
MKRIMPRNEGMVLIAALNAIGVLSVVVIAVVYYAV